MPAYITTHTVDVFRPVDEHTVDELAVPAQLGDTAGDTVATATPIALAEKAKRVQDPTTGLVVTERYHRALFERSVGIARGDVVTAAGLQPWRVTHVYTDHDSHALGVTRVDMSATV